MKRRVAVLVLAAVAAVGLSLAPASAGEPHRGKRGPLVVDDDRGHGWCKFGRARYDSIQEAVDAARDGQTILVCPGLYRETVEVGKRLTILGAQFGRDARHRDGGGKGEAVVTADSASALAVVQLLADGIVWDGFVIRGEGAEGGEDAPPSPPGMRTSPGASGYTIRNTIFQDNGLGIRVGSDGERPTVICRNRFVANNEFEGRGAASAIYSDEGARDVLITENLFQDHNGAAVLFADRLANSRIVQHGIRVERNKSVNDRAFAAFYASSHVVIARNKARARVDDPRFPGDANRLSAIFLGARNDHVLVQRNRVTSASGNGIHVTDSAEPNRGPGTAAPTNVVVEGNRVQHAQLSGLHLTPRTSNVLVRGNTALDNDRFDCEDASADGPVGSRTPGTENNRWLGNVGATADPDNICRPAVERRHAKAKHATYQHKQVKKQQPGRQRHHGKHDPDPCACGLPWRY